MAKTVLSRLFNLRSPCLPSSSPSPSSSSTSPSPNFSSRLMDENIDFAESIISKWDSDSSTGAKLGSLFSTGRAESARFLRAIADLRRAMLFFSSPDCPDPQSQSLIRSQSLMQSAMNRLEQEFHRILSTNDDICLSSTTDAIGDLRSIAESMMANGYGMECVRIYKLLRRSILEEALFRLGFDLRLPSTNLHKLDWPILDLRIKSWLSAAPTSFPAFLTSERLLCSHVFDASDSIDLDLDLAESCFVDVANAAALQFFSFPDHIARSKPSPEKLFRFLELHLTLSDLFPQIESIFSYESTASVKAKALEALRSLEDAARYSLAEFELSLQKESSRMPVPNSGIHLLTQNAMNYLARLADHLPTLSDVFAGFPFRPPEPLPEMSAPCSSTMAPAAVSDRIAWLLLLLLCKLDHKAEFYKDVSLSYLFLANNVQYVVNRVEESGLRMVLGFTWVERHQEAATRYWEIFSRLERQKSATAMLANPVEQVLDEPDGSEPAGPSMDSFFCSPYTWKYN